MNVSPDEFWQHLRQSGLISADRIDRLRRKIAEKPEICLAETADVLAKLLVTKGLLTHYQGQTLLHGIPGTFRLGPYTILEPDHELGAEGWFRARDNRQGTELRLRWLSDDESDSQGAAPELGPPGTRMETHEGKQVLLASSPDQPANGSVETTVPRISTATAPELPHKNYSRFAVLSAVSFPLLALIGVCCWLLMAHDQRPSERVPQSSNSAAKATSNADSVPADNNSLALWDRPDPGNPIQIQYLPADVQAILRVRLASLQEHPEGERILRSLGPEFDSTFTSWLSQVGAPASSIDHVTVGLLPQGSTLPKAVTVVQLTEATDRAAMPSYKAIDGSRVARVATSGCWFPAEAPRTFVQGPLDEILQLANSSEPNVQFRSAFERLIGRSHDTDQLTIIANANFLSDEASGLFPSSRRLLLSGLADLWSDEAQAVSLQLQLGEVAVAELRVVARAELAPRILAARIQQRLRDLPARLSNYVGGLQLDPYWQRLALRFPTMVRFVVDNSRVSVEQQEVAVSTALPVEAIHNLLLASELTLASSTMEVPEQNMVDRSRWTMQELLAANTSINIAQESLEAAVREMERQVQEDFPGLPFVFSIEILGADLQLEGITRNQQIRDFHQPEKSVAEILTALVIAANPVKTVVRAADAEQRLIWVPSADSPGKIFVTTRNGAKNRELPLPPAFLSE